MAVLGHIKQLFTFSHRLHRLRNHDLISLHDKYRSILLDLIFRELREKTWLLHSWMLYRFKQTNEMWKSFISITEVSFYILCHHYNFIKLYPSVDSHIFWRLQAYMHILNLNKAIAMRFSQKKKAWYRILNTLHSLWKNISLLLLIFYFQRGPFFLTHPVLMYCCHLCTLVIPRGRGGYHPYIADFSLSPQSQNESDLSHLENLFYIL